MLLEKQVGRGAAVGRRVSPGLGSRLSPGLQTLVCSASRAVCSQVFV